MDALQVLRRDHDLLRQKLTILESTLGAAPGAQTALRELCFTLQHVLSDHMEREQPLLDCSRPCAYPNPAAQRARSHLVELTMLRGVTERLFTGHRASEAAIVLRIEEAIARLQQQMSYQEESVFASITEELAVLGAPRPIDTSMSVNEILQHYPDTLRVFERLQVDRGYEGCDSLDELAWRRGVDSSDLVEQLRRAASWVRGR